MNVASTALSEVLVPRDSRPSEDDLLSGRMRIVSKISFDSGRIEFRSDGETKTGMIQIEPGDLVVSGINAYKGAIALYAADSIYPAAATIHYSAYHVRPDRADPRFLWYLLRSEGFRQVLANEVPGGIKTELKPARLLPIPVSLPPIPEQRRIVARLDELSHRIEQVQRLQWMAHAEAEGLLLAALRRLRQELSGRGGRLLRLGDLATVMAGGTPSRSNPAYWNGNIPWVKTGELLDGLINRTEENITEEGLRSSSAKLFPPGTVLIALYGQGQTRGRTGVLQIEAATNQACCGILPARSRLEPRFVQYWLQSLYDEMRELSRAGAQPNWNSGMIKSVQIAVPPLAEQRRMVNDLETLQQTTNALSNLQVEISAELEALRRSTLNSRLSR